MPDQLSPFPAELAAAPAECVLRDVEALRQRVGHENEGFLSAARGFVPLATPLTRLPEAFAPWDELAAELPDTYANLTLRGRVDRLPLLDASAASLEDRFLLRAAALLAIVSHAYWYVDCRPPRRLPDALGVPWAQVRARLGRQEEVLSYVDLIVYNWRPRDARQPALSVEGLDLLFPIAGNQEERVFYLTQLEILARAGALPSLLAAAQVAALRGENRTLEAALERIAAVFERSAEALAHIDPRTQASTHVEPVRWAKTVAPLAVPFRRGVLGPSGTSSPIFNALDAFFGRRQFDSALGREIRQLRRTYPPAWQRFVRALEDAPVGELVTRSGSRPVKDAWEHALAVYAGREGFLARHRRKVYGYLEIAFKVGRSVTIGGFGGAFADRTWNEVDAALVGAHAERPHAEPQPCLPLPAAGRIPAARAFDASAVAQHNQAEHGYWVVVHGIVYDVTRFIHAHPGGRSVLRAYAGLDASLGFARAHAETARLDRMRQALRIGVVRQLEFPDGRSEAACRAAVAALYLLVEMQNAFALDRSFALDAGLGTRRTAYERQRAFERHRRFLDEYVAVLERQTLPTLWSYARAGLFAEHADALPPLLHALQRTPTAAATRAAANLDFAAFDPADELGLQDAQIDAQDARDARLLDALKARLLAAVRAFEVHAPKLDECAATRVRRACLACIAELRRYYARSL